MLLGHWHHVPRRAIVLLATGVLITGCASGGATPSPVSGSPTALSPTTSPAETATAAPSEAAPVEITWGSFLTTNLTKEFWAGVVSAFEAKNPDVKVNVIYPPASQNEGNAYYKTLLTAGTFPDVVSNIQTADFVKAGALYAYDLSDPDLQQISNLDRLTTNGKLYDLASILQPISAVFYNKDLFAQAGISQPPTSNAELTSDMAALKKAGITPITSSGDFLAYLNLNAFSAPDAFGADPQWYTHRRAGTVHYAEGPYLAAAQKISDWAAKGYFAAGANGLTYQQTTQDFQDGKVAMIANGNWYTATLASTPPNFQVGVFAAPTVDGSKVLSAGQNGYCWVSATSQHVDAAVKLCKFIALDPAGHGAIVAADAAISGLKNPPPIKMNPLNQILADMLTTGGYRAVMLSNGMGDELPVPGQDNELGAAWQSLLAGKDPVGVMKDLDTWWDQGQQAGG